MSQTLSATARTLAGRKTNQLRAEGDVPAVVYGAGTEPLSITVKRNEFVQMYRVAGEGSMVELAIDGKEPLHVLIQDYQLDPLRDEVIHVDFRSVDLSKPIEATASLSFVGESAAVKALGGTLMRTRDSVRVRALPKDLVAQIEVDLSALATFDDAIRFGDLNLPEGLELADEPNLTVASISRPRTAKQMAALDEAPAEEALPEGAEETPAAQSEEAAS